MKKKLLYAIISLFSFTIVNAQNEGISFFTGTFQEALDKAEKENKLIFMDAYATWCGPCKMMSNSVFTNVEVGTFYNENFINLKMDMEKGEGIKLKNQFSVTAYPTLLYINYKGELVGKGIGFHKKESFIELGKSFLK